MHPRLCPHPIHEIPIHGSRNRLFDLGRHMVGINREIRRRIFGQMPRTKKLGAKILKYSPAYVVQEFGDLARVIIKDIVMEPLKKIINGEISLLLTYYMPRGFK